MGWWSLPPTSTLTPCPRPASVDPNSWATGLASNPSKIGLLSPSGGAGLSGVPGAPFANGPGGSTMRVTWTLHPWLQAAIAYSTRTVVRLTFEVRIDEPPNIDASPGSSEFTDGWFVGLSQGDGAPLGDGIAWGMYDDTIHVPLWRDLGGEDAGWTTTQWQPVVVPADKATFDWSLPIHCLVLAEQSSEPQPTPWTVHMRAMRLCIETQS